MNTPSTTVPIALNIAASAVAHMDSTASGVVANSSIRIRAESVTMFGRLPPTRDTFTNLVGKFFFGIFADTDAVAPNAVSNTAIAVFSAGFGVGWINT